MAGYSGTPLVQKLGIREGHRVGVLAPGVDFHDMLRNLPRGVDIRQDLRGGAFDVIVSFFKRRGDLERRIERLHAAMSPACGLWIAWPKRSSGVETDLTEDVIRDIALARGLVDNKVCAIDETWSGLRLVIRVKDRPAAPAKGSGRSRATGAKRRRSSAAR